MTVVNRLRTKEFVERDVLKSRTSCDGRHMILTFRELCCTTVQHPLTSMELWPRMDDSRRVRFFCAEPGCQFHDHELPLGLHEITAPVRCNGVSFFIGPNPVPKHRYIHVENRLDGLLKRAVQNDEAQFIGRSPSHK